MVGLFDHVGCSPDFLFAFLGPNGHPVLLGILELVDFLDEDFIAIGVLLDFGDHDLIKKVDLPKLLVVATLLIILGIN